MKILLLYAFLAFTSILHAQWYNQYFDGTDTIPYQSVFIELDTGINSLWQIGPPQKTIFDSPMTAPNVLVTDTTANIPDSSQSSFQFTLDDQSLAGSYMAIQWTQKLDLDTNADLGVIEYSKDTGNTWINVFNDPAVYSFYGFLPGNHGTHYSSGEEGFTGRDAVWRDIWLCFDYNFVNWGDTIIFRYTIKTDTSDGVYEGWMIDNFQVHSTWFHTIVENSKQESFNLYPTNTTGHVKVICQKTDNPPVIEIVELVDLSGRVIDRFKPEEVNFERDYGLVPDGSYKLKIITDQGFDICNIIIQH